MTTPVARWICIEHLAAIVALARCPAVPTATIAADARRPGLVDHRVDRRDRPSSQLPDVAPLASALAEPGDLGSVDAGPPAPGAPFGDLELDGVGADVDDRERGRLPSSSPRSARG